MPWCVAVDGAWYQMSAEAGEAMRAARDFLKIGLQSGISPRTPGFLATTRYPLLLSIDGIAVRGWPARVDENRHPVWLFETRWKALSESGTITAEQTLADVIDAAKVWLRSSGAP